MRKKGRWGKLGMKRNKRRASGSPQASAEKKRELCEKQRGGIRFQKKKIKHRESSKQEEPREEESSPSGEAPSKERQKERTGQGDP